MASLERRYDGRYRVVFYWQRQKFVHSLGDISEKDAQAAKVRMEENLRLLARGILDYDGSGDLGIFLLSDGKRTEKVAVARPITLGELVERYRAEHLPGSKEASTRVTEDIHLDHVLRILGKRLPLPSLTTEKVQEYVRKRSGEKSHYGRLVSHVTVKKEIASLAAVWNKWALPLGLVSHPAPTRGLSFKKSRQKQPFQTWEQIERRIARGGLTKDEQAELWESVFLSLNQIDELLRHVKGRGRAPWVHVMFACAAFTGARRSELLRLQIEDCDFETGTISIREKKKDHGKEFTFRTVPMAAPLRQVLEKWIQEHPGGQYVIASEDGSPVTVQMAAKAFRSAVGKSKWEQLSGYHVFRHSFASNCCLKGIDARIIDRWLGHQTEEMASRYRHLFPSQQQSAMQLVFG